MTARSSPGGDQRQQLLQAIAQPIPAVPMTAQYQLRLILAAAATVGIVLLYLAIILLAGWLSYRCLAAGVFGSGHTIRGGRNAILWFVINRAGPAFAWACVVVALFKPLLARRDEAGDESSVELQPEREPVLFEFVRRLCASVGAPPPASISVDGNVNASASFVRGPLDGRLRLTIGMPLVFGLNTRQLAGVMAHEFGHFAQRAGMRMTWLIRTVIHWLAHAAWGRDRWDEWLVAMSSGHDIRLSWVFLLARGVVWLARLVIKGLFLLAMFLCARLMQEMEFDADRYEARMAGSGSFAGTCRQLQLLNLSHGGALRDLDQFRREGRLPDNLPRLVVANVPLIPAEAFRKFEIEMLKLETGRFDTHPSDRDRIHNAATERAAGVFRLELPSPLLFADPDGLSRLVTKRLYGDAFGESVDKHQLQKTEQLVSEVNRQSGDQLAGQAFLLQQYSHLRTFFLPRHMPGPAVSVAEYKARTSQRREALLRLVVGHHTTRLEGDSFGEELKGTVGALRLLESGVSLSATGQSFPVTDKPTARNRLVELARREEDRFRRLEAFRRLMGDRLIEALELAQVAEVRKRLGPQVDEPLVLERMLVCWNTLHANMLFWDRFVVECQVTGQLLEVAGNIADENLGKLLEKQGQRLYRLLKQLRTGCEKPVYPFTHAHGKVSLGAYLLPRMPAPGNAGEIIGAALETANSFGIVVNRCAMRLTAIASRIEKLAGFAPLALPAELREAEPADQEYGS